jgi:hypothetical protein
MVVTKKIIEIKIFTKVKSSLIVHIMVNDKLDDQNKVEIIKRIGRGGFR